MIEFSASAEEMPAKKKKNKRQHNGDAKQESPERTDPKKIKLQKQQEQQQQEQQQNSSQQGATEVAPLKAIKPIFIAANIKKVRDLCQGLKLNIKPTFKVSSNSSTQILCGSLNDKKEIITALKANNIDHHTFTEPSEKAFTVVLKGFYDIDPVELLTLLKNHNVPADKVSVLYKNENYSLYLVIFQQNNINCNILNHAHRIIDDVAIKWEPVKSKSKIPLQCHRCQRWGHSASNCGFPYRCVKCIDNHPIGQCTRTTKEGTPKCCNCKGDHAANHRGCEAYKAFEKKKVSQKNIKSRPAQMVQNRLTNNTVFPALPSSQQQLVQHHMNHSVMTPTYSAQVKQVSATGSSSESNPKVIELSQLSGRLEEVPNIDNALRLLNQLIKKLNEESNDKKRVYIIMQYCFDFKLPDLEGVESTLSNSHG